MICEHFIYGLFPEGYKLIKSKGLDTMIDGEDLKALIHIGDAVAEPTYIVHYWQKQMLLSYSHITRAQDKYGRGGVRNHTVLVPINSLIQPLSKVFNAESNLLEPISLSVKTT